MVRRVLGIVCVAALSVMLISCAKAAEPSGVGNTIIVVEEDPHVKNSPPTEAKEEAVDVNIDSSIETEEEVLVIESVDAVSKDDVLIDESEPELDGLDDYDPAYMKTTPEMIQGVEVLLGDTSYRDNLEDDCLVELADSYFDEGYYVVDADTLALNGATFSIDGNRHYFYRGFMAAYNTDTQAEIRYYFIMTEEQLFAFIDQYDSFTSGYTDNGSVIEFSFRDAGMTLKYYKDTELMEYVMSYSN
ncbi:MAG: hypothetical protein K6G47_11760 [Clostridia bacterium]|nr:hypothetical protein [Clostridia bacterium]